MIDFSSIYSGISGSTGAATGGGLTGTGTGVRPEFYGGVGAANAPTAAGYAINSPTNQALGVAGRGPDPSQMPAGASLTPPKQNSMSGGSGVGSQLADSIKAIGDMISNYQTAGAYGQQQVAAHTPNMTITPALASFSIPTVGAHRM